MGAGDEQGGGVSLAGIDFRKLVDVATDPIIVHDGGTILYANRAAAALIGATGPEPLVGTAILQFVAEEYRPSVAERARQLTAQGGTLGGNLRALVRLDGVRVEVETTGVALGEGRTLVLIRDASRLVRAEQARRSAESRLSTVFDAAAEAMAFSVGDRFERVNGAFLRLFRFPPSEEAVGLSAEDLLAPGELPRFQERDRRRQAGEPLPAEYTARCVRRDGTEIDVEVKTAELREGERVTTISVMRDVTERLAAERARSESERRLRELFQLVPIALWEHDASGILRVVERLRAEGVADLRAHFAAHPEAVVECVGALRVVDVNAAAWQVHGARSREELLANLDKVFLPEFLAGYGELVARLAEGATSVQLELGGSSLDGRRLRIELTVRTIPGHEADWKRILASTVDVTERRRAEEERGALHERLRQSEKLEAVGRLAGGIAHDFNNILAAILGYAELTGGALEPGSELRENQARIREAALRARALVRQILAFSRRDTANRRIVDVPAIVDEALSLMRAGIPASVTLVARLDPEAGATLADPTQIHQIVLNLCSNARDAVGTYGRIEVEVSTVEVDGDVPELAPGRYVRLRVRDDGTGMDEATRARIFEPYMTTKGPFGGHGLGLAVVHGIVTAALGAIRVDSAPGRGSTFDVYLPRHESPKAEAPSPRPEASRGGERILLVDDEPLVRTATRRVLESLGYAVETAEDGGQALARFRASPGAFDLVLTDQTMPTLSGADLARALLAARPELPIVLCTGYGDGFGEAAARELGVRAILMKPVDRATMAAALREALDGR